MPEISIKTGYFFAIIFTLFGWITAINLSLVPQFIIYASLAWFITTSWKVQQLELGAIPYFIIFIGYSLGVLAGNAAYFLKYGYTSSNTLSFLWDLITP